MPTIRLLDARRGLNLKCRELFRDEKIAEEIYRFLCDGIEECEDAEPERKKGRWIPSDTDGFVCSVCWNGYRIQPTLMGKPMFEYCPVCGAKMEGAEDDS